MNNLNSYIKKNVNLSQFFPKIKEERAKNFTTITLSFLSIMFFGIFAISPTLNTISDINKKLSDDQFVDTQLTQKITNITSLQQQYTKMQNSLILINDAIPTTPQTTTLLAQLQSVSSQSRVQLVRAQILPVEISQNTSSSYNSFGFALDASGSQTTIDNFLKNLENFNRLVFITNYSIVEASAKTNELRIDIKGKAFFKK